MITIKLPYTTQNNEEKELISKYIGNYNNVLRFTYNRLIDSNNSLSTKDLTECQKSMNNVFIDSHFKNSAIFESKAFFKKSKDIPVLFGGKKLFEDRRQERISREEFLEKRNLPLCSIGEAPQKGNRKFQIISENLILFKPSKNDHIYLTLPKLRRNWKEKLLELKILQDSKKIPITYKLDTKFIYISFEETLERNSEDSQEEDRIEDRIFSIDLNPNYLGWSVVDWKDRDQYKVISSGVVSLKKINDLSNSLNSKNLSSESKERKYLNNKRNFEIVEISSTLATLAKHYQCSIFSCESLKIKSSDKKKGRRFNRLVNNQWNRNLLIKQIKKRCNLLNIDFYQVQPDYSSFVGNLAYSETGLPDMVLSSIEIGRRAYEWYHQYVKKDKNIVKNIVFNESEINLSRIKKSLEELKYFAGFRNIKDLYKEIKTLNLRYRVSLNENLEFFSLKSIKSLLYCYNKLYFNTF